MPPSYVAAYVKRGKTDAADAAAICEAVNPPTPLLCCLGTSPIQAARRQGL
jgi:transposase